MTPLAGLRPQRLADAHNAKRFKKSKHGKNKHRTGQSHHVESASSGFEGEDEEEMEEDGDEEWDPSVYEVQMESALKALERSFGGLRASGATPSVLDTVHVSAYESRLPLKQVAQVIVRDARMLEVRCFDPTIEKEVKTAIEVANLGLNPVADGKGKLTIIVPKPTRETREKLKKIATEEAEGTRNAIRSVRRKAMEKLKKESEGMPKADIKSIEKDIQELTDLWNKKTIEALHAKIKDIDVI